MWIVYALLSAFTASLVAILGKLGLKGIDTTLATTVRGIIMALFLILVSFSLGKFNGFSLTSLTNREWLLIAASGVAGALSWLFYFAAIKHGVTTSAVAIDKLSIVFVVVLAGLFLGEAVGWKGFLGAGLVALGAFLISVK